MNRPPRIAVVDSGIHGAHEHVRGVAGGVAILADGSEGSDFTDRMGHGTAVAAAIREKVPEAELFAVKIFDRKLATSADTLVRAIRWCTGHGMDWINLSLGTSNPEHAAVFQEPIAEALARNAMIVSAYDHDGIRWMPGSLQGVIGVRLDWECPRDEYRIEVLEDGRALYRASGYPRPIPGLSPDRNLRGVSFAVANVTGLLARSALCAQIVTVK